MANLLYYWLLEPNRGYIDDDGVRAASIEMNLSANGIQYIFAYIAMTKASRGLPKYRFQMWIMRKSPNQHCQ